MLSETALKPITPAQLRSLAERKAAEEARKDHETMKKAEENRKHLHETFLSQETRPDAMERVMTAVQRAAEQGKTELLALQFPSSYLPDGGRKINNFEPDWPGSLDGFAKRAFDFFAQHLQPQGYKCRAQILDYPDGKPGEVGIFLSW
jgi:hypothetical protein